MLLSTAILLVSSANAGLSIIVHPSLGTYGVSSSVMELVDHARKDPFAVKYGNDQPRRLMVSSFYPVDLVDQCQPYTEPYMPPATAAVYDGMYDSLGLPDGIFGAFEMSFCRDHASQTSAGLNTSFPLVLFSPGLGNSRLIYSGIAQSLSSQGYIVITVDHPYDASIVEYPDGSHTLAANITTPKQILFDLDVRVKDMTFLIDQFRSKSIEDPLLGTAIGACDLDHVLMYGHSLGGATAVATMHADPRVMGAVDLDGSLWGSVTSEGLGCPLMLFAHQGKNLTTDASWQQTWKHTQETTKVELELEESTEGTFTDFPLLAETLGVSDELSGELAKLIGKLPGTQVDNILNRYLGQFFEYALGHVFSPTPGSKGKMSSRVNVLEEVKSGNCASPFAVEL